MVCCATGSHRVLGRGLHGPVQPDRDRAARLRRLLDQRADRRRRTVSPPAPTNRATPSSRAAISVRTAGSTARANPASGASSRSRGGEPDPGQVVDGRLDLLVVGLPQHGHRIGLTVRRPGGPVGDGGAAVICESIGVSAAASAPVTAGRSPGGQPVQQHGDHRGRLHAPARPPGRPPGPAAACSVRSASRCPAASCGCTTVGAQCTDPRGPAGSGRRPGQLDLGQVAPGPAGPEIPAQRRPRRRRGRWRCAPAPARRSAGARRAPPARRPAARPRPPGRR